MKGVFFYALLALVAILSKSDAGLLDELGNQKLLMKIMTALCNSLNKRAIKRLIKPCAQAEEYLKRAEAAKGTCTDTTFQCADGSKCIDNKLKCNYLDDCGDFSDEIDCKCFQEEGEFECVAGGCVFNSWKCDGAPDCVDGSDEDNCESKPPPEAEHQIKGTEDCEDDAEGCKPADCNDDIGKMFCSKTCGQCQVCEDDPLILSCAKWKDDCGKDTENGRQTDLLCPKTCGLCA